MSYYPHAATGTTYPYGSYHPQNSQPYPGAHAHVQAAGAYPTTPYQTPYPHGAVGGYSATWPYPYPYYTPQSVTQSPATTARTTTLNLATPAAATTATTAATTAAPTPTPAPSIQRQSSVSTYPFQQQATRETVAAASSGGVVPRNVRKQNAHRGLFTKECKLYLSCSLVLTNCCLQCET